MLDLLFVVDTSASMADEGELLVSQLELLTRELVAPSEEGVPVVEDIHVGVITSDLGAGGNAVDHCEGSGQDGRFLRGWSAHAFDAPDLGTHPDNPPIWEEIARNELINSDGCSYSQPLEAAYRALIEHGASGGPHEGFLREYSYLAIVFITDGDDCSAMDSSFFDPNRNDLELPSLRCGLNADELRPVSDYYNAFVAASGSRARTSIAVIGGVPIDGSWNPGDPLERLRALQSIDPEDPNRLVSGCDTAYGRAELPVRLTELAYAAESRGVLLSICRDEWAAVLQRLTRDLGHGWALWRNCCRTRPPDPASSCRLLELLSDDRPCYFTADAADESRSQGWHIDIGLIESEGSERRQCLVLPADLDDDGVPDNLDGWYLSEPSASCSGGTLSLTNRRIYQAGSRWRFECVFEP